MTVRVTVPNPSLRVQVARPATGVDAGSSQGPAGPSGAGYTHPQPVASAVWTIQHDLGFKPTVQVYGLAGEVVYADIEHYSDNAVIVRLLAPLAGGARLT
jgi:hypothetical protein